MIKVVLSPIFLLPLALVSPYIFMGPYGITIFEFIVVGTFFTFTVRRLWNDTFRLPKFLLLYFSLFLMGWLGALINGAAWGMPVSLANLKFFYYIVLAIGGYYIGYRRYVPIDSIVSHPVFKLVIFGLFMVAAIYPFLDYDQRISLLRIFFGPGVGDLDRLHSPRFPGLGVNANVYSFMVFTALLFSFDAYYFRNKISWIYPLFAFIVILTAGSKLVTVIAVASCLALLMLNLASLHKSAVRRFGQVAVGIGVLVTAAYFYLNYTTLGRDILDTTVIVRRFASLFNQLPGADDVSGFAARYEMWGLGMQRVQLAPILGIVADRFTSSDTNTLYFAHPHNEFIWLWMFYGLAGLIAHILLIAGLIGRNLRRREWMWVLFYTMLSVHMLYDAAFTAVRFQAMFFLIVGLNIKHLHKISPRGTSNTPQLRARFGQ